MKMRKAIARAFLARMAAKGDGLAFRVAAAGVAAVAGLEINQRQMTRRDRDAPKLKGGRALEGGGFGGGTRSFAGAQLADPPSVGLLRLVQGPRGAFGHGHPEPPAARAAD